MSRRVQEEAAQRSGEVIERLQAAYERFRESRLYVQVICSAILVACGWLIHLLPDGPWSGVDSGLRWVVTVDYDFRGQASRLNGWAKGQGGWLKAGAGLWQQGLERSRDWAGLRPAAPAPSLSASPPTPSPPAEEPRGGPEAPAPAADLPPLQPVEGSVLWEYGWLPPGVGEEFHEGIDFLAKTGAPVVAVMDGTVVAIRQDPKLGQVVEVRHGQVIAAYAQVEGVEVRAGDEVRRGQVIATVARARGAEQNTPPHLHFEIRPAQSGEPVDPASYLGLGGKKL